MYDRKVDPRRRRNCTLKGWLPEGNSDGRLVAENACYGYVPPTTNRACASRAALGTAAELGIEEIAEGIAQHVEPEDGQADGDAGKHGHPRSLEHVGPTRAA